MKTFDIKDVFSWSNAEQANAYINKSGYFADNLDDLRECVNNDNFQILFLVDLDPKIDVDSIFSITEMDYKYALFIPLSKVKEVENLKKYRAFKDFEELSETLNKGVGSEIIYRLKKEPLRKITTSIIGYITEDNREDLILIGMSALSLSTYFEEIEIWNNVEKQWQPFGVLEND